jgi:hypothetical protein
MKLLVLICCFALDSSFANNYHKFGNIGEHPCVSWAINISHPNSCKLWFWMRNVHHWLLHAFLVTLWEFFPTPQGNTSKFGLNLDGIIFHVPEKNIKFSRVDASYGDSLFVSLWTFYRVYFVQMPQTHCTIINLTKKYLWIMIVN